MNKPIRVLLVDDQPCTRASLRALLGTLPGVRGVEEAGDGLDALERVQQRPPDIVLMDVRMPILDGFDATRLIKQRLPSIKIIILSMDGELSREAMAAGADAFVGKTESPQRLLETFAAVAGAYSAGVKE